MTRFHVDSDAVEGATSAVQSTIGRIQADVSGMHSHLANLQASWGGHAAEAFQGVVAEWQSAQQRVEEALSSINAALGAVGRQYAETEMANARLFAT